MIDEFFKFLARILQLKGEKQYQQALALINEATQTLLHMDMNELDSNEYDISRIIGDKKLSLDQLEVLAGLLKVKADIHLDTNNTFSAISQYGKSLYLYEYVQDTSRDFSLERVNLIKEINLALVNLEG
jgi:hypothetical protein